MKKVLVIGGYGNFGSFITQHLVEDLEIFVIVAGRSLSKAQKFIASLPKGRAEAAYIDIEKDFEITLRKILPDIVIHTSGPFQHQSYEVARSCMDAGCHYIDLADGREFVENILKLNDEAKEKGVAIISGASSVPCLTSAIVDHYQGEFSALQSLDYGITTAQKTNRGLATVASILSYTGQPFTTMIGGKNKKIFGWQGLRYRSYPALGKRLLGYCNIPDLGLFPKRYRELQTVRFYAGLEIPFLHISLWILSWLVRFRLIRRLEKFAPLMLKASFFLDIFGTSNSGFHMEIKGKDKTGNDKKVLFELSAGSGDGPYIPCMPAILLAKKLARGEIEFRGASPCMGFLTLDEYLDSLKTLDIHWQVKTGLV